MWKTVHAGVNLPKDIAVEGGVDAKGNTLFVGRADLEGGITPGTVTPNGSHCEVSNDCSGVAVEKYQVLTNPKDANLVWMPASNGHVPTGAIVGGWDPNGDECYIGRFHHEGAVRVGKVHRSSELCFIADGEKEVCSPYYEVLTFNTVRLDTDDHHGSTSSCSATDFLNDVDVDAEEVFSPQPDDQDT